MMFLKKKVFRILGEIIAKDGDTVEITNEAEVKVKVRCLQKMIYIIRHLCMIIMYHIRLRIRENQYFILCDYREGAKDSRYFGAVEMEEIREKCYNYKKK